MGESDFKHAKGSSTKFLSLRERDSLAYSQTLHRKLRNVMVTQKNFDKGLEEIDFLNCAKTKCRGPFSQKLHNVPSGPNPIGNFASMGVQPP
ncbi:hypothetical protein SUGI_0848410 [Cryptomeria japonica]|nr:hypothetical protein SUGI_0848410 [Cryptomeria japonica]